jgi:hypothetical protein
MMNIKSQVMKTLKLLILIFSIPCLQEASGQWNTNGNNIYNTNSGYVAIGNNAPTTLLYVAKSMTEPTITVRNFGGAGGATYTMTDNASGANWKFKATNSGGFKIRDNAFGLDVLQLEANSAANVLYINAAGSLGVNTSTPDASAQVDISSTTKGFLPPRMTEAQLSAIPSPANGLMVYNTSDGKLYVFLEGSNTWKEIQFGAGTIVPQ